MIHRAELYQFRQQHTGLSQLISDPFHLSANISAFFHTDEVIIRNWKVGGRGYVKKSC